MGGTRRRPGPDHGPPTTSPKTGGCAPALTRRRRLTPKKRRKRAEVRKRKQQKKTAELVEGSRASAAAAFLQGLLDRPVEARDDELEPQPVAAALALPDVGASSDSSLGMPLLTGTSDSDAAAPARAAAKNRRERTLSDTSSGYSDIEPAPAEPVPRAHSDDDPNMIAALQWSGERLLALPKEEIPKWRDQDLVDAVDYHILGKGHAVMSHKGSAQRTFRHAEE